MDCRIELDNREIHAVMPGDDSLSFLEACWRADVYKKHNPNAVFTVYNNANNDCLYQV